MLFLILMARILDRKNARYDAESLSLYSRSKTHREELLSVTLPPLFRVNGHTSLCPLDLSLGPYLHPSDVVNLAPFPHFQVVADRSPV